MDPEGHDLIVTGLPNDLSRSQFYALFLRFEGMTRCDLITEPGTDRMLGYGFVGYKRFVDAQKALEEMDGCVIGQDMLRVAWTRRSRPKGFDVKILNMLNPSVGRRVLKELFAQFGDVRRAEVDYDRQTGEPAGYAFITFASYQQAEAAMWAFGGRFAQDGTMIVNWLEGTPLVRCELERIRTTKDELNGYKKTADAQIIDFGDDSMTASSGPGGSSAPPTPLNFGHRLVHSWTDSWTSAVPASDSQGRRASTDSSNAINSEPAPSSTDINAQPSPSPLGNAPWCPGVDLNSLNLYEPSAVPRQPLSLWPVPHRVAYVHTESLRRIVLRFFAVDEAQMKETIADIRLMGAQGADSPNGLDAHVFKTILVVSSVSDVPAFAKAVVRSGFDAFTW